jgi:hypothetical protein
MAPTEIDRLVARLLPSVLADRDLGDGRSFTSLHLRNLWALSCLHAGECYDEDLLLDLVERHLPRSVMLNCEIHARSA